MQKNEITQLYKPFLILILISFSIFGINRIIDILLIKYQIEFFANFFPKDLNILGNTIGSLADLVVGVLGIEITVIAIIVQLAATKYSSKIIELFIGHRINFVVISIFVVTAVNTVLVTNTMHETLITSYSLSFSILLIIIGLLIVIPHFSYVFNFLRPDTFLGYVRDKAIKIMDEAKNADAGKIDKLKEEINKQINFIGDVALNSTSQADRAVTLLCIGYLREIAVHYLNSKKQLPEKWFQLSGEEYFDPDFSSYSSFVMKRIEEDKVLLERKIFGLYELIFNNARLTLRDVASGVLLNSELIAIEAIEQKDKGALHCAFQFFNSYLRIAIRERDPRSAFNTLEHYRNIAKELLKAEPEEVEKVAFYFKYYGQEANKFQVLFIIETAAHDLCRINELAYEYKVENLRKLLDQFLTLDEPIEESQEKTSTKELSLIGVRIAQVKLAGFYLLNGEHELARIIYNDLKVEPKTRIQKIKEIIFNTKEEEFWEITPRGINFYFLTPERREALLEFFSWFEKNNYEAT
jgi:hypothetical protein